MHNRPLGRTGIVVSEVGFGAWGIGGRTEGLTSYGATDDAISRSAVSRAVERGITFFDTSSVYGYGHSESLLGEVLHGVRDRVVIATKAGFAGWTGQPEFSKAGLMRSLEESLRRLRTDYVDLFQLHNPTLADLQRDEVIETLSLVVRQGKARSWGVSLRSPDEALAAHAAMSIPVVQVNLNMLDVRAVSSGFLDVAGKNGIGVIARTPLCFGFLSGAIREGTKFPAGDHRLGWRSEQIRTWIDGANRVLGMVKSPAGATNVQNALRFCLSFPSVSAVIPGILSPDEVDQNCGASELGALSEEELAAILLENNRTSFFVGR